MLTQLIRYGTVGLVSNGLLLGIYYILTYPAGITPEIAASITFALGVLWTYAFNRKWSFRSDAKHQTALPKYVVSYLAAYVFTIGTLSLGYRLMGLPHLLAQVLAILFSAVVLFLLLKLWVFPKIGDLSSGSHKS